MTFGQYLERRQAGDPATAAYLAEADPDILVATSWPDVMGCLLKRNADAAYIDRTRQLFQEFSRANARTINA